jgi:hypothetical protein
VKIGLDIHGVIDSNLKMFSELTNLLIAAGHEVHILTGPKTETVIDFLKTNKIAYTHLFSIVEDAEANGIMVRWDAEGPWIDSEFWDRSKARYCQRNNIDLHIDDSPQYEKYFKTPFALYKKK